MKIFDKRVHYIVGFFWFSFVWNFIIWLLINWFDTFADTFWLVFIVYCIFSQTWLRYVWLMACQIRLSVICDVRAPYSWDTFDHLATHPPKIAKIVQGNHLLRANLPNRRVPVRLLCKVAKYNRKGLVKQANLAYRRLYHQVTFGYLISWWVFCTFTCCYVMFIYYYGVTNRPK